MPPQNATSQSTIIYVCLHLGETSVEAFGTAFHSCQAEPAGARGRPLGGLRVERKVLNDSSDDDDLLCEQLRLRHILHNSS